MKASKFKQAVRGLDPQKAFDTALAMGGLYMPNGDESTDRFSFEDDSVAHVKRTSPVQVTAEDADGNLLS